MVAAAGVVATVVVCAVRCMQRKAAVTVGISQYPTTRVPAAIIDGEPQ